MCPTSKKRVPNRKLIALRINAGLSPNQLAARVHVSGPTIRLAERGHIPEPRVQAEIAHFFELDPLDIWPLDTQRELVR